MTGGSLPPVISGVGGGPGIQASHVHRVGWSIA
jgi:hypothetical protein